MTLLHENGYKALVATKPSDRLQVAVLELRSKMVEVGEGNLDVTVGLANQYDEVGDLNRDFNHMVQQLRESRGQIERLHCAQMSRVEHLAALGELAAGLAHEIRNPLAGIAGVIEIMTRDLPVTSPARVVVQDVHLEITRIERIVTDLLQAAHPHLPQVRPSDLNTTVERAVALVRLQVLSRPIKIELNRDPNLPDVEHDNDQIYQLLLNLLLNAVQAIDGAGEIRVEVSLLKGDAAIIVVDTGRGISPEHLPNIFLPFYTTKRNGTGLGLSLARRITEQHHGRIDVASEVGKGTRFVVVLPLLQATARAAAS